MKRIKPREITPEEFAKVDKRRFINLVIDPGDEPTVLNHEQAVEFRKLLSECSK